MSLDFDVKGLLHRAINSQRFLEFTREDLRKREEKHEQAMKALEPHRKQLSKQDADKFFDRLMDDTEKRKKNRLDMLMLSCSIKLCQCAPYL